MSVDAAVWFVALLAAFWPASKGTSAKVEQFPPILNVLIGGNESMYCKFPIVQDTAEVSWWKEGENAFIEPDSRNQFSVQKGRGTYTLLNVSYADIGVYYCQVKSQQQILGNGSGSQLIVLIPPTPLKIDPIGQCSSPRQLLCKTAAFNPKEIEIVWQKNKKQIRTGIKTVIYQNREGSYEAYSLLEINPSASGKDVHTCLASHVSLTKPVSYSYSNTLEQDADTRLILQCAVGGSAILNLILIIVLLKHKLKRSQGGNANSLNGCQNEDPAEQAPVEHTTAYASLNHRENKPFRKNPQPEEGVIYSQTKGNEADKLTYAALQIPDSNYTQASKHQSKHSLYADINTSKKQ